MMISDEPDEPLPLSLPDKILLNRASCEEFFDFEIDKQFTTEALEYLTYEALRSLTSSDEDRDAARMELPVWLAAAAVHCLKPGGVKRPKGKQRHDWRTQRAVMQAVMWARLRKPEPPEPPDPMLAWARARYKEFRKEYLAAEESKPSGKKPEVLRQEAALLVAEEAKAKFASLLSKQEIARRMERPGAYP